MKRLIGLTTCLLVMVLPYQSASVHPVAQRATEYYMFLFTCEDTPGDLAYYTPWVDERISRYTFFAWWYDRGYWNFVPNNYISCDKVCLRLRALDLHFDGPAASRMHLWRMGAEVMDPVNEPIDWGVLSDLGSPDNELVRSTAEHWFCWGEKWPQDFWVVKYEKEGDHRRNMTKVRYVETNGYEHWFYLVP
ncbi:MAG: hypothetical protein HY314_07655 [Acidobacteria bacterium]|nr:hypothetical protein [Acidobacteriota bacterium]